MTNYFAVEGSFDVAATGFFSSKMPKLLKTIADFFCLEGLARKQWPSFSEKTVLLANDGAFFSEEP